MFYFYDVKGRARDVRARPLLCFDAVGPAPSAPVIFVALGSAINSSEEGWSSGDHVNGFELHGDMGVKYEKAGWGFVG